MLSRPRSSAGAATSAVAAGLLLILAGCSDGGSDAPVAAPSSSSAASRPASPTAVPSASASPAAAASPTTAPVAGRYVDPDGFTITYPKDWAVRPDLGGLQVVGKPSKQLAPDFADNVGVLLENTQMKSLTVQQYVTASVQNAPKQVPDFKVLAMDAKAGTLEYTGTVQRPLHFLARVIVKNGKAFTATFTATADSFAANRPAAEKVLNSLKAT